MPTPPVQGYHCLSLRPPATATSLPPPPVTTPRLPPPPLPITTAHLTPVTATSCYIKPCHHNSRDPCLYHPLQPPLVTIVTTFPHHHHPCHRCSSTTTPYNYKPHDPCLRSPSQHRWVHGSLRRLLSCTPSMPSSCAWAPRTTSWRATPPFTLSWLRLRPCCTRPRPGGGSSVTDLGL